MRLAAMTVIGLVGPAAYGCAVELAAPGDDLQAASGELVEVCTLSGTAWFLGYGVGARPQPSGTRFTYRFEEPAPGATKVRLQLGWERSDRTSGAYRWDNVPWLDLHTTTPAAGLRQFRREVPSSGNLIQLDLEPGRASIVHQGTVAAAHASGLNPRRLFRVEAQAEPLQCVPARKSSLPAQPQSRFRDILREMAMRPEASGRAYDEMQVVRGAMSQEAPLCRSMRNPPPARVIASADSSAAVVPREPVATRLVDTRTEGLFGSRVRLTCEAGGEAKDRACVYVVETTNSCVDLTCDQPCGAAIFGTGGMAEVTCRGDCCHLVADFAVERRFRMTCSDGLPAHHCESEGTVACGGCACLDAVLDEALAGGAGPANRTPGER